MDKELKDLVLIEATNLRKYATPEELARLNIDRLNANDPQYCIYGQMTGECFTKRAAELIKLCCSKVVKRDMRISGEIIQLSNKLIKPYRLKNNEPFNRFSHYFSPIEKYLFTCSEQDRENLIEFIQSKTDTL